MGCQIFNTWAFCGNSVCLSHNRIQSYLQTVTHHYLVTFQPVANYVYSAVAEDHYGVDESVSHTDVDRCSSHVCRDASGSLNYYDSSNTNLQSRTLDNDRRLCDRFMRSLYFYFRVFCLLTETGLVRRRMLCHPDNSLPWLHRILWAWDNFMVLCSPWPQGIEVYSRD